MNADTTLLGNNWWKLTSSRFVINGIDSTKNARTKFKHHNQRCLIMTLYLQTKEKPLHRNTFFCFAHFFNTNGSTIKWKSEKHIFKSYTTFVVVVVCKLCISKLHELVSGGSSNNSLRKTFLPPVQLNVWKADFSIKKVVSSFLYFDIISIDRIMFANEVKKFSDFNGQTTLRLLNQEISSMFVSACYKCHFFLLLELSLFLSAVKTLHYCMYSYIRKQWTVLTIEWVVMTWNSNQWLQKVVIQIVCFH